MTGADERTLCLLQPHRRRDHAVRVEGSRFRGAPGAAGARRKVSPHGPLCRKARPEPSLCVSRCTEASRHRRPLADGNAHEPGRSKSDRPWISMVRFRQRIGGIQDGRHSRPPPLPTPMPSCSLPENGCRGRHGARRHRRDTEPVHIPEGPDTP